MINENFQCNHGIASTFSYCYQTNIPRETGITLSGTSAKTLLLFIPCALFILCYREVFDGMVRIHKSDVERVPIVADKDK